MRQGISSATLLFFILIAALLPASWAGASTAPAVCEPAIIVGSGADPQSGEITIQGTECPDLIVAGTTTESIDAGGGDDVVIGAAGVATLDGGAGQDTIYANGAQQAAGGADDDQLFGDEVPELGTEAAAPLEAALLPFVDEFGVQAVENAVGQAGAEMASSSGSADSSFAYVFDPGWVMVFDPNSDRDGPDDLWGGSGNDDLFGFGGNDRLFGDIGDDVLRGGDGNDLLSGGQGGDNLNGQEGSDQLRGDGTIDKIFDTGEGGSDEDTISFAGGVTPGFRDVPSRPGDPNDYSAFPAEGGERGVYIDLTNRIADNGKAKDGGGLDNAAFLFGLENIIGTPYADYIVGDSGANVVDGGGGPDVILGAGGNDTLYGNAGHDNVTGGDGADYIDGGPGKDFCEGEGELSCDETGTSSDAVIARDDTKVQVGLIARPGISHRDFYLTGSTGIDEVAVFFASASGEDPNRIRFELTNNNVSFDVSEAEKTPLCDYTQANGNPKRVVCDSYHRIGTIIVAGLDGDDDLFGPERGMPRTTTYISTGNDGNDWIKGTKTSDDLLVDGAGDDILLGFAGHDGLMNNSGIDQIWLGYGDDLAITATLCDNGLVDGVPTADQIHGSVGLDNASWAQLPSDTYNGVAARLAEGRFGYKSANGPSCDNHGGKRGSIDGFESLEGSAMADWLVGDDKRNTLMGRPGEDLLSAGPGADSIRARNDDDDIIYCGTGVDGGLADPLPLDDQEYGCDDKLERG